ncbi:uncharacterized protein EI90DRAFT_3041349 [Cantharellus anzutake]|uniref:uncharacterized protein n=1 Tax=Cantharellus anzutake TaxID=1750568 RepID=UPI001905ADFC|nr:uncharacterized protein EI90DRAFT_3041349 [Cantharellus anzutake]KAF8338030.1 hypothetical protein EI90DRAFT_3041349 [Cantharellus anzutake]
MVSLLMPNHVVLFIECILRLGAVDCAEADQCCESISVFARICVTPLNQIVAEILSQLCTQQHAGRERCSVPHSLYCSDTKYKLSTSRTSKPKSVLDLSKCSKDRLRLPIIAMDGASRTIDCKGNDEVEAVGNQ